MYFAQVQTLLRWKISNRVICNAVRSSSVSNLAKRKPVTAKSLFYNTAVCMGLCGVGDILAQVKAYTARPYGPDFIIFSCGKMRILLKLPNLLIKHV